MRIMWDSFIMAVTSLWSKPARSLLSMLGIVIGILTINALLTIALSVREEITSSVEGLGANLVMVLPGVLDEDTGPDVTSQLGASTLTEADFDAIRREIPLATDPVMAMLLGGSVQYEGVTAKSSLIFASSAGIEAAMNLNVARGRSVRHEDNDQNKKVAVLGSEAKESLFGGAPAMGENVVIRGHEFEVVGILKEKQMGVSLGGPDFNQLVIVPITTGWEITDTKQIFRILMQAEDAQSVTELKEKVHAVLLDSHGGEEDFSVVTQEDMLGIISNVLDILTMLLTALATISLVVGGVGIMNIMLVSVSERTREVGIRRAVGATRFHIMVQFLIESILLTVVGGVFALSLFGVLVRLINPYLPLTLTVDLRVVVLSLFFAVLIGVVSGVIPAWKASRQNTVDALRYE